MDRHSYFLAVALAYVALSFLLAASERPRRSSPAGMLVTAFAAIGVGCLLQGSDAALPFWLHAVVGNLLAWLGLIYQAWAILALSGRSVTRRGRWIAGGLLLAVVVALTLAPAAVKYGGANLVYAVLFAYTAWILLSWREGAVVLRGITASLFGASAVLYAIRGIGFTMQEAPLTASQVPVLASWVTDVLLPLSYTTLLSSAFGLLLLIRRVSEDKLEVATTELARLAAYDELTDLPNRRYLIDRVVAECSIATRTGRPLCVAIVDLDGLKTINDRYGHAAGDEALQRLATACRSVLREQDLAARLGGDEFAVLLPDSRLSDALAALGRVLTALRDSAGRLTDGLTASIGVAQLEPEESVDSVFARADAAMYESKRAGGGLVTGHPIAEVIDEPERASL